MVGLSYQVSPALKESLQKIEHFRRQVLLTPLPPKTEIRLRWETMIERLYWSLNLAENSLTKNEMVKLLIHREGKKLHADGKQILGYKKALDYISQEWLVSTKMVTAKTVLLLHELASCPGSFRLSETRLNPFLDYLQVNPENPTIAAAIAQMQIIELSPFTDGNGRVSRLLALLFLYKYGYDCRGMLALEEYFRRDLAALKSHTDHALKTGSLTGWIEYFAKGLQTQLEKAAQKVLSPRFDLALSTSFWEINERQKEILSLLEEPGQAITNKKAQKIFKVSQITASRDLAKLATLGLLFPHGKGRSVYYTRA